MAFSDRMKEWLDQGAQASKEFITKAGAKAQDLGERGVLMLEVKQLEGQAQKLVARLGNEAYQAFVERGAKSISVDTAAVKTILAEIASVKDAIEKKEAELQRRKG
jgi:ribosomal protein S16